jgi:hypothetical protein
MPTIIAQRAWFQRIAFTNKGNVMTHEEALNLIEQAKHHLFLAETAYDEYKSSKFSGSDSYRDACYEEANKHWKKRDYLFSLVKEAGFAELIS